MRVKERIHFVVPALLILFVISACKLTITNTTGPGLASTLSVITITITGSSEADLGNADEHGLVLQIPENWEVESAEVKYSTYTHELTRNSAHEGLYTAEPNHKVLVITTEENKFLNYGWNGTVTVKLLVGDFAGAFGDTRSYTLKFAAGVCRVPDGGGDCQWETDDPAGEFDFSNITAEKYVHQVTVKKSHIGAAEREALIALYDSTNGDDWTDNSGWKEPPLVDGFAMPGTEGAWHGVTLTIHPNTVNSTVLELSLFSNNLVGTLPVELENLTNLEVLSLSGNQLGGTIPPELGNLSNLQTLDLSGNQLSGLIPSGLGNLTHLTSLYLNSNKLTGEIPTTLTNLSGLTPDDDSSRTTDLGYNGLFTDDDDLLEFLEGEDSFGGKLGSDPDWETTQTVAPEDVVASSLSTTSIELSWTPILYTADSGSYHVYSATDPGGPFSFYGQTSSKADSSLTVEGVASGTTYYFYVETVTDPHPPVNQNTVISEKSSILQLRTPVLMPWIPLLLFDD